MRVCVGVGCLIILSALSHMSNGRGGQSVDTGMLIPVQPSEAAAGHDPFPRMCNFEHVLREA